MLFIIIILKLIFKNISIQMQPYFNINIPIPQNQE